MSSVLGDLPYVRVYIEDIIIFSDSYTEHVVHVAEVLRRLNHFNLRVQPPKCRLFHPAVLYLGHMVSGSGIRISNARVAEIAELRPPTTGKQM